MATFNEIINGDVPVLVDFFADWCGPCKMMSPILQDVSRQLGSSVKILKVDVDKNQNAARVYAVQGVPTLIVFKQGKQVWRKSGVVGAEELVATLKGFYD